MSTASTLRLPALHDPAWRGRVSVLVLAAVLLWPALVWTEFRPWTVFDEQSLQSTGKFLREFVPPRHDVEFLHLMLVQTWRTVAIATAGLVLAFVVAVPLALVSSARLSISSLGGRMGGGPYVLRQLARWAAIVLRSVPELVWARARRIGSREIPWSLACGGADLI